jgi:uroporphyrinogen decarboxylase
MLKGLWEPNFDRMLTVLRRQGEPDRVPFFELFHDREIMEGVMGASLPEGEAGLRFRIDFMLRLNYDYVVVPQTFSFPRDTGFVADDTAERSKGQRGWRDEHRGPIETWEDFERYEWPTPRDEHFAEIEMAADMLPEGMMVTSTLPGGVLENLTDLMGYERLCFALIDEPDLVQAIADRVGAGELAIYERLCRYDHIGALWLNDDLGFKTQTMIGPADLRKYVFPWHKRLVEYAHSHGKLAILHACGNLAQVMEDLIEDVGIDAKHSYEDVIQPVADFKAKYGSRIAVLGGIDVDMLTRGTEDEVRSYTRRIIEQCAPGGGWTLGSGNSVANYIPIPNFLAMLDEGRKVGVYS